MMPMKLLIAEDALGVAEVLTFGAHMIWPDCHVMTAVNGQEALRHFTADPPDFVILDVEMPPPNGFEVCRRIRETSRVPILMLTVLSDTMDKVRALDLGADDYLTKPFDHLELLARMRALMRRSNESLIPSHSTVMIGDLSIDFSTRAVHIRDEVVHLTSTEFRLLAVLAQHAGTVLPHHFLLTHVWGAEYVRDVQYLKVFVRRLRQKLAVVPEDVPYIQTEWGIGYRFVPSP